MTLVIALAEQFEISTDADGYTMLICPLHRGAHNSITNDAYVDIGEATTILNYKHVAMTHLKDEHGDVIQ